jgi:ketosteroid isomerase-like protein
MLRSEAIVREFYDFFDKGQIEKVIQLCSRSIDFRLVGPSTVPYMGAFKGHDGVRKFFETQDRAERLVRFERRRYIATPEAVAVVGGEEGIARSTGKTFKTEWAHVFVIANDMVASFLEIIDTAALSSAFVR